MNAEKRAIRQLLRERRKNLAPSTVQAAGAAVRARVQQAAWYRAAVAVILYIAEENEIPTEAILADVVRAGKRIYLPLAGSAGRVACWQPGEPLRKGRAGVLEPVNQIAADPAGATVAFVPIVGWDARGVRLGRGGGYYDRLFSRLAHGVLRVGLAYDFQECGVLPRDSWDATLDCVITERRVVWCSESTMRSGPLQKEGV